MRLLLKNLEQWERLGTKNCHSNTLNIFVFGALELTLFCEWMYKFETSHFHRCMRTTDMYSSSIFARPSVVKSDLRDREMPCSSYPAHDSSQVRALGRSIRILPQEVDIEHVEIDKLYRWTESSTVLHWLKQETTSICCQQNSRISGKLFNGSMETIKVFENPADICTRGMSFDGFEEFELLNGTAWLQKVEKKGPKPRCQENEFEPEQAIKAAATES